MRSSSSCREAEGLREGGREGGGEGGREGERVQRRKESEEGGREVITVTDGERGTI